MGARGLSFVQYGKETIATHGTAVAATKILAGAEIKGVPVDRKPEFIEDALGVRARSARVVTYETLVEDTLSVPNAYFQCLPLFFSLGLKGNVTASETTASQQDYAWAFTPSMTASNTLDSATLEFGDGDQEYECEYTMFKNLKVKGTIDQGGGASPVSIEGQYFARQMTPSTKTAALSLPTMTTMNAKNARLYKDTAWAGKGATEVTAILREFEFEIMTGVHPKFFGDANKYFATHGEDRIDAMLTLLLEHGSSAHAFYTDWQAGTAKAYAIKIAGPQIGSGTTHALNMFMWGVVESVIPISSESNGNNLTAVVIHGTYDTTGAQIVDVNVTTNANAI